MAPSDIREWVRERAGDGSCRCPEAIIGAAKLEVLREGDQTRAVRCRSVSQLGGTADVGLGIGTRVELDESDRKPLAPMVRRDRRRAASGATSPRLPQRMPVS